MPRRPHSRRPAAIALAAGLLVAAGGTTGLLLTRQATPARLPPPRGVATVAAPTGPFATLAAQPQPTRLREPPASAPQLRATQPTPTRSTRSGRSSPGSANPVTAAPAPVARPVALTIPLIGVRTSLIKLGRAADGTLEVPSSTAVASWYTGSPRPGAVGPSLILGHVDSVAGPGVFFRLSELHRGDRVYVSRADGTTAVFRVTEVQMYPKDAFPTQSVYGGTPDPELRLITCGGVFDPATGHYLSNVIVYAAEQP